MFTKKTLKRTVRTFIQAAISYLAVNIFVIDFSSGKEVAKSTAVGLLVSAGAAGIAAVMNLENKESEGE